jgi:twitching motility two-component system response regulator PilH
VNNDTEGEQMAIKKVLVVDDSVTETKNMQGILSDAGCLVVTASNGKDAVKTAKAERPDMIFLDIIMPDMDGFETCRVLKSDKDTASIPIVILSSKDQKADMLWAQMQGAQAYVTKPYTPDQIVDTLRSVS